MRQLHNRPNDTEIMEYVDRSLTSKINLNCKTPFLIGARENGSKVSNLFNKPFDRQ